MTGAGNVEPAIGAAAAPPRRRLTVVGAGTMGIGIAAALLAAGHEVELVEPDAAAAASVPDRVRTILEDSERRGKLADAADAAEHLHGVHSSLAATAPEPDALIEAVPEQLERKRAVLAEAERLEPALLASNTSAISIDLLAAELQRPDRFLGMHFFNPVAAMALVELVVGSETGREAVDAAAALVGELGKEAIEVRDAPGFASSRLGVLLGMEAIRMVEEGIAEAAAIDRAMELGYRHPVGPLRLTDIVGLDVRMAIASDLGRTYGEHFRPPPLLVDLVERGRLGKKSGRGFYEWT